MKDFFKKIEEILSYVDSIVKKNELKEVFFRGQNRASYNLIPGLGRVHVKNLAEIENLLYYDFVQYGGHLIQPYKNTWDVLYLMQHHGIPTRLLDWSESLLTALYFSIKDSISSEDSAIWILDPYDLNHSSNNMEFISYFDVDFPKGYYNYFVDEMYPEYGQFPKTIIAIGINPPNARIVAQKGAFTFHNPEDLKNPLEILFPQTVKKIVIERELFESAKKFLFVSGFNEFTMFPDLDGLSRYIRDREF
jgi:hypothetical protein